MPPRKEIAPELVAEGRRLYEQTLTPVDEIGARMGVSRSVLYARVKEWKWHRRRYSSGDDGLAGLSADIAVVDLTEVAVASSSGPVTAERRAALGARLFRAAELTMTAIERMLRTLNPNNEAQSERAARTTAALNRSLREVAAIVKPDAVITDDSSQDQVPRDIDELRSELARRINAFVDSRRGSGAAGDQGRDSRLERGGV